MTGVLIFGLGIVCGFYVCHRMLKKTFEGISYPLAIRFGEWIYASPSFPENEVPDGYVLLENPNFLFLQKKKEVPEADIKHNPILDELVHHIPLALWCRSTRGRIVYCNKVYSDIVEAPVSKIIHESIELYPDLIKQVLKTRQPQITRRHIVLAGERRYVQLAEIPVHQGIVGYAIDLSEMDDKVSQCTKQVYAHEDLLNHLSSPIAIYGEDTRLCLYNQAYVKQFEFAESFLRTNPTLTEVLDHLREKRKIPEFEDFRQHKQERLALFKSIFQPIYEWVHQPDGRILRLVILPYPLGGIVYIFEDVTEKIALERSYNTLSSVQKTTLDHLYEGILVLGTDYRVKLWNHAFEQLWSTAELENKHFKELGIDDDLFLKLMNGRCHAEGKLSLQPEKHLSYTYVPLPDGSHLFSFVDITSQINIEQVALEKQKMMTQIDRMRSQMISQVSQNLKAPLETIKTLSTQLDHSPSDLHKPLDEFIDRIDGVLDVTELKANTLALHLQPVVIRDFLSQIVDFIRPELNAHELEFFLDIHTRHTNMRVDPKRMRLVFLHLLRNAIRFTPKGGQITLRVKDLITNHVEIAVQDTGVGISYSEQESVFNSLDECVHMNLCFIKNIIHLHGGDMSLSSKPGKGTSIRCVIQCDELS